MAENILVNITYENIMFLAYYILIITVAYTAVIIIIVGVGQKTRILNLSKQSKIRFPQWEGKGIINRTCITGTGSRQIVTTGIKRAGEYPGTTRASLRLYND